MPLIFRGVWLHPYPVKITVGHLLILLGTGAWAFFGRLGTDPNSLLGRGRNFAAETIPFMESFKLEPSPAAAPVAPPVKPLTAVEDKLPISEVPLVPVPLASEFNSEPAAPLAVTEAVKPLPASSVENSAVGEPTSPEISSEGGEKAKHKAAAKPASKAKTISKPAAKTSTKPAVKTMAAKPVAAKAASAKPAAKSAAKKATKDSLMGTYVALTLKTGNVVKGVLLEKTATNYKLELPGMGGFDYPADTVKSVAAAE